MSATRTRTTSKVRTTTSPVLPAVDPIKVTVGSREVTLLPRLTESGNVAWSLQGRRADQSRYHSGYGVQVPMRAFGIVQLPNLVAVEDPQIDAGKKLVLKLEAGVTAKGNARRQGFVTVQTDQGPKRLFVSISQIAADMFNVILTVDGVGMSKGFKPKEYTDAQLDSLLG